MIVSQCQIHHWSDFDLAIDNDSLVFDSMQAQNCSLRQIDYGSAHQRTEDASITDRESASSHILNGELIVTSLNYCQKVKQAVIKMVITFLPRSAIAFSMPTRSI